MAIYVFYIYLFINLGVCIAFFHEQNVFISSWFKLYLCLHLSMYIESKVK